MAFFAQICLGEPQHLAFYHSEVDADCHEDVELIESQTCRPYYEIKCEEEEIFVEEITHKKECRKIVDIVCGGNKVEETEEKNEV